MITLQPASIRGSLMLPASKSMTHRAYILAALSGKPVEILHPLVSDDTRITAECLRRLGYDVVEEPQATHINRIPRKQPERVSLDFGMSGTTARLMTAYSALFDIPITLDGAHRMRERPMKELFCALEELGCKIEHTNYFLPAHIVSPIRSALTHIHAGASSQFLSALLLLAPYTPHGLEIRVEGEIASRSYSDMTIAMMEEYGIVVGRTVHGYSVSNRQEYIIPRQMRVERDFSSASYCIAGAAITQGDVFLESARIPSLQGDSAMLDIAEAFGAIITHEQNGIRIQGAACKSVDVDMNTCPDIVPTVAVMAIFGSAPSRLREVAHLRFKESDRIEAVLSNIHRLGGEGYMDGNDMIIVPVPHDTLHGAVIDVFDDHRIAMCFAVAGLRIPGVQIAHPHVVAKSFPTFWAEWDSICKRAHTL